MDSMDSLVASVKDAAMSHVRNHVVPEIIEQREAVFKQRLLYQLMTSASEVLSQYNYENASTDGWDRIEAAMLVSNLSDYNIRINTTISGTDDNISLKFTCNADVYDPNMEYSDRTKELVDEIMNLAFENFNKTARYDV